MNDDEPWNCDICGKTEKCDNCLGEEEAAEDPLTTEPEHEMVAVRRSDLVTIMSALSGPDYLIRELQAIRSLGDSPLDRLEEAYISGDCL